MKLNEAEATGIDLGLVIVIEMESLWNPSIITIIIAMFSHSMIKYSLFRKNSTYKLDHRHFAISKTRPVRPHANVLIWLKMHTSFVFLSGLSQISCILFKFGPISRIFLYYYWLCCCWVPPKNSSSFLHLKIWINRLGVAKGRLIWVGKCDVIILLVDSDSKRGGSESFI